MCKYEDICLNSDKCFRCFEYNLLKTSAQKNNLKKRSYKDLNSSRSWKFLEEDIADKTFSRRARGSGNKWFEKADVVHELFYFECKERSPYISNGDKSFSIKKSWIEKAERDSLGKPVVIPFRFKGENEIYTVMKADDIIELINSYTSLAERRNTNG